MPDVLREPLINRAKFDPTNPTHLESFKIFLRTGNWGDIQFYSELPYIEVPMTVLMKYAEHKTGVNRESAIERSERLNSKPNLKRLPLFEMPRTERARRAQELEKINTVLLDQIQELRAQASH